MNNLKLALTGLAMAAPLFAPTAIAQSGVNNAQCVIAATVYSRAGNDKQKKVAELAEAFYLGSLSGSSQQMQAEFARQVRTITNQNSGNIMTACAQAMNAKVQQARAAQQAAARSIRK
jgi:hypothetical protein